MSAVIINEPQKKAVLEHLQRGDIKAVKHALGWQGTNDDDLSFDQFKSLVEVLVETNANTDTEEQALVAWVAKNKPFQATLQEKLKSGAVGAGSTMGGFIEFVLSQVAPSPSNKPLAAGLAQKDNDPALDDEMSQFLFSTPSAAVAAQHVSPSLTPSTSTAPNLATNLGAPTNVPGAAPPGSNPVLPSQTGQVQQTAQSNQQTVSNGPSLLANAPAAAPPGPNPVLPPQAGQLQNLTNAMVHNSQQTVSNGPPYRPSASVPPGTVTTTSAQTLEVFKDYCNELSNTLGDKTPLAAGSESFTIPSHNIKVEYLTNDTIQTTISTDDLEELKKVIPDILEANKKAGIASLSPNGPTKNVKYIIDEMLKRDLTPTFDETTKKDLLSRGLDVDKYIADVKPTLLAAAANTTTLKAAKPS